MISNSAEIVALIISLITIHVTKERENGFKNLQYISSTHFLTYWLSNFVFDFIICSFNIISIMSVLKLVDVVRNDPTNEIYPMVNNSSFFYTCLIFIISSLSWCPLAYLTSFIFKSDIMSFIVLFIILSVAAFLDMIWSFVELFINIDTSGQLSTASNILNVLRFFFAFLFPNVTIKRALYNIKINKNLYCINTLNTILKGNFINKLNR